MPLKNAQKLSTILFGLGFAMICLGAWLQWLPLTLLGLLPWAGSGVIGFLYYRCPHCNKFLGRSGGTYCPFCGEKLDL